MTEQQHPATSTTRRDFMKAAAAGTALAVNLGVLSNVHAAGSDTIKVGLIGCGGRGSGAARDVLRSAPNVEIVAIGDVFGFRVNRLRNDLLKTSQDEEIKKLGNKAAVPEDRCFVGLDCHDRVIQSDCNYVILATPPGFRPLHIEKVVAAGKNLFTEKPVGVDGPGIRKVLAAYDDSLKKNLGIGAGTQRRHQTSYLEAMKRVHGGDIGAITALRCYWNGNGIWFRDRKELVKNNEKATDLAFHMHNWYHFVWTCGDHIVEQHVHNLDVCNWAMGTHPVRAIGMGSRLGGNSARPDGKPEEVGHIFDNFAIDFEYENGVHMLSMCRHIPGTATSVSEAIVGAKGTLNSADGGRNEIVGEKPWSFRGDRDNAPYVQEHTDLIASIRAGKPINELKNVAESTLTAIQGRMAAYTGKPVSWSAALNSKESTFPSTPLAWDMSLPVPPVAIPGRTPLV